MYANIFPVHGACNNLLFPLCRSGLGRNGGAADRSLPHFLLMIVPEKVIESRDIL